MALKRWSSKRHQTDGALQWTSATYLICVRLGERLEKIMLGIVLRYDCLWRHIISIRHCVLDTTISRKKGCFYWGTSSCEISKNDHLWRNIGLINQNMCGEVTDGQVVRASISVTWNVLSWSIGQAFEPQSGRTWGAWYLCPKSYLNQNINCQCISLSESLCIWNHLRPLR